MNKQIQSLKYHLIYIFIFCIFTGCSQTITSDQLTAIKQGKQFWLWDSPYGKINTHYIEKGDGSNHILLIHGFGAYSYTWHSIIDSLAAAGYHVWNLDLVGFGLSDKPEQLPYGLDLFVEHIRAFMQAKNISEAHLVGNSMGGGLVLATAIKFPQSVRSLTLIDALAYPLNLPAPLAITKMLGSTAKFFQGPFTTRKILEQVVYDNSKITDQQIDAYTLPLLMPGGSDALISTLKNFDQKQLKELNQQFASIHQPMLIIWGQEDRWISMDHFEHLQQDFPSAQTLVIPQCGHIPQEECPIQVTQAIVTFLNTCCSKNHQKTIEHNLPKID